MTPAEIAEKLRASESEMVFYLTFLARDGKIEITGVKARSRENDREAARYIRGGSS